MTEMTRLIASRILEDHFYRFGEDEKKSRILYLRLGNEWVLSSSPADECKAELLEKILKEIKASNDCAEQGHTLMCTNDNTLPSKLIVQLKPVSPDYSANLLVFTARRRPYHDKYIAELEVRLRGNPLPFNTNHVLRGELPEVAEAYLQNARIYLGFQKKEEQPPIEELTALTDA